MHDLITTTLFIAAILLSVVTFVAHGGEELTENIWRVSPPLFSAGPPGAFDEVSVKDPSLVYYEGRWHLFYTARSKRHYSLGYAVADTLEALSSAQRHHLTQLRSEKSRYAAAPQVFFFAPRGLWCLVFQTRDELYQPVIATTATLADPTSWSAPMPLVGKHEPDKWIDFWVLCDAERAYLYYTRNHRDVYVMDTAVEQFPEGFANPRMVFSPVHEAVHVYKVKDKPVYNMICEYQDENDVRHFGLAVAPHPVGPWTVTEPRYAVGSQLIFPGDTPPWTAEVSHGEVLRIGFDQNLEYDPSRMQLFIQGLPEGAHTGPYEMLPWSLGLIVLSPAENL